MGSSFEEQCTICEDCSKREGGPLDHFERQDLEKRTCPGTSKPGVPTSSFCDVRGARLTDLIGVSQPSGSRGYVGRCGADGPGGDPGF